MDATTQIQRLQEFFEGHFHAELLEAIRTGKDKLIVEFDALAQFDPELANMLLEEPENTLKACEIAVEQLEGAKGFSLRFRGLPTTQEIPVRDLRAKHLAKFIQMTGIVRQKSDVRPQITAARFECPSCGNIISVLQLDTKFREPTRCGCGRKGKFRLLSKELVDAQKIVLEESPDDLDGGEQPKRLNVFLRKDLVAPITDKKTNPGSKVMVTGYLKEVPIVLQQGGQSTRYDLMLEVNHIEPVEEDYSQISITPEEEEQIMAIAHDPKPLDRLVKSLAPSVYGHDRIKEAIVLQLLGGVKKKRSDGNSTRGDLHILLVGDPGSGKSTLLKRSQVVAPKSRFVSGKGASAAGLTASVVKDDFLKGWALEAGALVLANKGFCVTADTKIRTSAGTLTIDALHRRFLQKMPPEVLGIDYDSLSLRFDNIKNISVREERTRRITIENGDALQVTDEHPILVWDNGYEWKKAGDIAPGDVIFTKRKFPLPTDYPLTVDYLRDSHFVKLDVKETFQIANLSMVSTSTGIPEHRLWSYNRITIGDIKKLCQYSDRAFDEIKLLITTDDLPKHVSADLGEFAGLIASDGHLTAEKCGIKFHNTSPELLDRYRNLVSSLFRKNVSDYAREGQHTLHFSSPDVHSLLQGLGVRRGNKSKNAMDFTPMHEMPADFIQAFLSGYINGDGSVSARKSGGIISVVGGSSETLESLRNMIRPLGILAKVQEFRALGGGVCENGGDLWKLNITGVSNFRRIDSRRLISYKQDNLAKIVASNDLSCRIPKVEKLYRSLNSQIPHTEKRVLYRNGLRVSQLHRFAVSRPVFEKTTRELAEMNPAKYTDEIKLFTKVLDEGMIHMKVVSVEDAGVAAVYNLQMSMKDNPNFIANNFITHNCMIDELDKMSPEDRSAFHEALESQTVTISKANIQATLRCETVVLAAANPKFGRFDPYELLAKQIDLPPALINRFDLIFPVRDLPGIEKDRQLAGFVLQLQQTGDIQEVPVSTNILRKYISYARSRCFPKLTDEAVKEIQEFYVEMRNAGTNEKEGGISAIPISARQLEALVRMSEASARSRLGDAVTRDDARRAIDLLMHCLQQLGVDPQTGKMDIDRLTTGVTASQRNQVHTIKQIIKELADVTGNPLVSEDEILAKAQELGVAEDKAEEILEKLNRMGDIFRPKPGFYSTMK